MSYRRFVHAALATVIVASLGVTYYAVTEPKASAAVPVPDYFGAIPNYANSPLPTNGPTLAFSGGGGSGAAATVLVDASGGVSGVLVTAGGSAYSSPPAIAISGAGSGATATAVLASAVGAITVTNPGVTTYTAPFVTFAGGGGTGAAATAILGTNGLLQSIRLDDGGSGYTSEPTVTITDDNIGATPAHGTGATATATLTSSVDSVTVTDPGSGYLNVSGGVRKFVDSLPGVGASNANDLGQYIPAAVPDTTSFPGVAPWPGSGSPRADYYEIGLVQYKEQLHKDLPPTELEGYVQLETPVNASTSKHIALTYLNGIPIKDLAGAQVYAYDKPSYLGPMISAQKDTPVRIKFTNYLPTGSGGNLFLPVDTTMMGAGDGPTQTGTSGGKAVYAQYSQNRAGMHLHGGLTPWISDGTPDQWTTPAGENTAYPKGVSVQYVPDMWFNSNGKLVASPSGATNNPGSGSLTFYYSNQQSARLMWVHDHSLGMTRLNVYAGEVSGYQLHDPTQTALVDNGTLPSTEVPLTIQDKTFVPRSTQLAQEDPTWDTQKYGGFGNLWFPHVYMPNQNPASDSGANDMGRWDYGPWFWPPFVGQTHGPVTNPLAGSTPQEGPVNPGTPNPTQTPEAFMDTPLVNGTAYPTLSVTPKAYRFQVLNASNDRTLNLQLYYAKSNATMWNANGTLNDANAGEVPMVEAVKTAGYPSTWPTDGRDGGVPDPSAAGPDIVQIGTDGGILPAPVTLKNTPVGYNFNRRDIVVLNIANHTLMLGPAERADIVVDFSAVPAGSKLILYNDAPAPVPAFDPRYDYYTGDPDQTSTGGAPTTLPGYGPNTRTIMQFQVAGVAAPAFNLARLKAAQPTAYAATQDKPIVPESAYNAAFKANYTDTYARIQHSSLSFTPAGSTSPVTLPMQPKAIQELFDPDYGRMNSTLGVELPNTTGTNQTTIPLGYQDPATETMGNSVGDVGATGASKIGTAADGTQIWKITHNGVDTHTIHFHLFNVQLVNRVGWDGAIRPPDPNELGWKESVRMNPLEDAIVALRPVAPTLPFKIPDSVRPYDVTRPIGSMMGFTGIDPLTNNPVAVTNQLFNFGWEYVWHCHVLGHEENDMMRPIAFQVSPQPLTNLAAARSGANVNLTWTNGGAAPLETNAFVQRSTDSNFTGGLTTFSTGPAPVKTFTDTSPPSSAAYYRIRAENAVSYSIWSNSAVVVAAPKPADPTNLKAAPWPAPSVAITLTWSESTGGAVTFTIQRSTSSSFNTVTQVSAGSTSKTFTDSSGLATRTTYYYRVEAVLAGVTSGWTTTSARTN